jgi:hypothetical protein
MQLTMNYYATLSFFNLFNMITTEFNDCQYTIAHLDILDSINVCSEASEFASLNDACKHQYGRFEHA